MKRALFVFALVASPALAQEMDHSTHQMDHSQHRAATGAPASDEPEIGNDPPPSVPTDHAADRFFPLDRMDRARKALADESRFTAFAVRIDQLESRVVNGRDGFAWDGEARFRADIDRSLSPARVRASSVTGRRRPNCGVWRHAVEPWCNLELGVSHDFRPHPERTYALVGIQGLGPYCLEIDAQMFVSNKRDLHVRSGLGYDRRITQRLILEPEA